MKPKTILYFLGIIFILNFVGVFILRLSLYAWTEFYFSLFFNLIFWACSFYLIYKIVSIIEPLKN